MSQVLILEGPDGAGKTTLARKIADETGAVVWHEGPPPPGRDQLQHYASEILRALRAKRPVIFDRCHLGEYVYGPVARGEDTLTSWGVRLLKRLLRANNILCMICLPEYETCLRNWKRRQGEEYLKNEARFHEVYYRYKGLTAYYPEVNPYAVDPFKIITKESMLWPTLPEGTIGNGSGRVLVVGEQSNTDLDLPFFSLTHSSGYLNRALEQAGFDESDLVLTNSMKKNGKARSLKQVMQAMPNFKIAIALGRWAEKACRLYDVPCVQIHHPSCHKRFHYKKQDAYVRRLEEIRCSL